MNKEIVNSVENMLSGDVLNAISSFTAENESTVSKALQEIIPYLFEKARVFLEANSHPADLLSLIDQLPDFNNKDEFIRQAGEHKAGTNTIGKILSLITGNTGDAFEHHINHVAGLKSGSFSALMSMGAMLLFRPMKRYLQQRPTQGLSLHHWMMDNPLAQVFGPVQPASVKKEKKKKSGFNWLWLLLALLFALLLWGVLHSCSESQPAKTVTKTMTATTGTVKTIWANLGELFKKRLPNGTTINIPQAGMENKLLAFIESDKAASESPWFSFDRLLFESNSRQLKPESNEQLSNIADIMQAYPKVKIKLGGYTDNTGTDEFNTQLSQDRADSVLESLVALGVDRSRLAAKGYGSAHPVADNDTDEHRSRNRRIDIQVTRK